MADDSNNNNEYTDHQRDNPTSSSNSQFTIQSDVPSANEDIISPTTVTINNLSIGIPDTGDENGNCNTTTSTGDESTPTEIMTPSSSLDSQRVSWEPSLQFPIRARGELQLQNDDRGLSQLENEKIDNVHYQVLPDDTSSVCLPVIRSLDSLVDSDIVGVGAPLSTKGSQRSLDASNDAEWRVRDLESGLETATSMSESNLNTESEYPTPVEEPTILNPDENTLVVPAPGNPITNTALPSEMFEKIKPFGKGLRKRMTLLSKRKLKRKNKEEAPTSKTKRVKKYVKQLLYGDAPRKKFEIRSEEELECTKKLIIDLIYALLCFGMPVYLIDYHASLISVSYGIGLMLDFTGNGFLITFTSGFFRLGHDTRFIKLKSSAWDLTKLTLLDDIAANIASGAVNVKEGQQMIKDVMVRKPIYAHVGFSLFVYFLCAGVLSTLNGLLVQEILGSMLAGVFVAVCVTRIPIYVPSLAPITHAICTLVSSVVCIVLKLILAQFGLPFHTITPVLYSLFMILPGLTFTISISEIARRYGRAGFFRLLIGLVAGLQIAATFVACQFIELNFNLAEIPRVSSYYAWWVEVLIVPLGGVAFAVGLKAPHEPLSILFIIIDCYLTHFLNRHIGRLTIPEFGAFTGAFTAHIVALFFGWVSHRHPTIITSCALYYEVPGSMFVKATVSLIHKDVAEGVSKAFQAMLTGLAIGLGMIIADFLPLHHRHKKLRLFRKKQPVK